MLSERQRSIYMNAITQLHHSLMWKIKGIIGTMYSLRPRSKMFQKKAVINFYAVVEINQCSVPHEAHRGVSLLCEWPHSLSPLVPKRAATAVHLCPSEALPQGWLLVDTGNDGVSCCRWLGHHTPESTSRTPNLISSDKIEVPNFGLWDPPKAVSTYLSRCIFSCFHSSSTPPTTYFLMLHHKFQQFWNIFSFLMYLGTVALK